MVLQRQRHHDPLKSFVGFVLGDVSYALPIGRVKEIANPLDIVPLPHAPPAVIGVADYRGEVVPVVDMRVRFGLPPTERTRRTKWVVLNVDERFAALVVDGVTEVFGTGPGATELRPAPSLGGGESLRGIAGVTTHSGQLVFVLETDWLRELAESLDASGALGPHLASIAPMLQKGAG